ncbi:MAG: hypothetical protein Kow0068_01770 [Marinilabiliales bacterium]
MDADDIAHPERLEQQILFLKQNLHVGAVATQVVYYGNIKNNKGFKRYVDWNNSIVDYNNILISRFIEMPVINPTLLWRREVSEKFGIYQNGNFPEDYEMILRWLHNKVVISKLKSKLLVWNDTAKRLTRTDIRYSDDAFYKIKIKYLAYWLVKNNPFHPDVYVWGASRISRKKIKYLEENGINVACYIDISTKRQLDKKIIYFKNIPDKSKAFILVLMKNEKIRNEIVRFLDSKSYVQGENYLLIS